MYFILSIAEFRLSQSKLNYFTATSELNAKQNTLRTKMEWRKNIAILNQKSDLRCYTFAPLGSCAYLHKYICLI